MVWRFDADNSTLRRRIDDGVTSTASSSRMNSSACSSESTRGGISRTSSSAEAARTFVMLKAINLVTTVRVGEEAERGLDEAMHGEIAYQLDTV